MTDLIHEWVQRHRWLRNFRAASQELKLTPQERYAYRHHLHNLNLGGVAHPDGSLSTFLNATIEADGRTFVIPTVWDNKVVDTAEAVKRAKAAGLSNWPSYDSEEAATARYNAMHGYMERDVGRRLNANASRERTGSNDAGGVEGTKPAGTTR